jgi:hypothetical protein
MSSDFEKYLDEWAGTKRFVRGIVPLKDGEKPGDFGLAYVYYEEENAWSWVNRMGFPIPSGMREETDEEYRERILKELQ